MEIEIIKGKRPTKKYAWVQQGPIEGKKEKKKKHKLATFLKPITVQLLKRE